ncbi:unnamed protein product [Ectocarpus sp. 6 AP-2014]
MSGGSACMDVLRGGLSWPGVVMLWTGVWTMLDRHVPGGTGLWKELGLAVAGAWIMVWTRTFFSNAGMDSLDQEGSLSEMGSLLVQGRLRWRDEAKFYARSLLAIVGSILFWDGVYDLCDEHTWKGTLTYNLVCASLGGAGMVWVMTSEDEDERMRGDDIGGGPAAMMVSAANRSGGRSSRLGPDNRGRLYAKALFCNVCGVVFWKGVEEIIEDNGPNKDWTGLVFFVVGISILIATDRLSMNSGLEDGLPPAVDIQAGPAACKIEIAAWDASSSNPDLRAPSSSPLLLDRVVNDLSCPGCSWLVAAPTSFCGDNVRSPCGGEGAGSRRRGGGCVEVPRWVTTAAELTGVVFAWTGIEWYVWEGDYIPDSALRDLGYIAVGLGILVGTGTFFNLAGTISPVAALKQVHQHNRHEEAMPLLSNSDQAETEPDTHSHVTEARATFDVTASLPPASQYAFFGVS